ncbi:metallophosphoesterase [Rhizobium sp. NTR19]|uniref:Metallophosphoesterase n=1 Tax=Neorhizobium turbinariae TaxID=2937795 RepID=A0ABT0ISG6_9HYPH|nr:metallophosphoesterase [Neorhizobium turbinariae]MCK8780799.1 metallophosphoesterase [Neorhizobium turbinariae]
MPYQPTHTYVIGDVHGRADLLEAMLGHFAKEGAAKGFPYRIIFLGDIIDRGPFSRDALAQVREAVRGIPGSRFILGNHDAIPLTIFDESSSERAERRLLHWITNQGGDATLSSYGLDIETLTLAGFRHHFDKEHLAFLRQGQRYVELERHILVHAGIKPGIPLPRQDLHDLMWIREPFLHHQGTFGKVVIHGHTPTETGVPELYPNRLALDTKAYASGRLTAAHLIDAEIFELLWTSPNSPHAVEVISPLTIDYHSSP